MDARYITYGKGDKLMTYDSPEAYKKAVGPSYRFSPGRIRSYIGVTS